MNFFRNARNISNVILFTFIFLSLRNISALALNEEESKRIVKNDSIEEVLNYGSDSLISDYYIIDTGDNLLIDFEDIDIYSNNYSVDRAGYVTIPEIGNYFVRGKTISEIKTDLTKKFEEFIYEPNIKIQISNFRPVKVFVSGEVNNPGIYNVDNFEETTEPNINISLDKGGGSESNLEQNSKSLNEYPKLFNALRAVGGVTNNADLSRVEVIRTNPNITGGGKKIAKLNLLDLIIYGNQDSNIFIYDDDIIHVPRSEKIIKEQFLAVNKINLNPRNIVVFISGNVVEGGPRQVKKGSSLVQAVASTGGKKMFSGKLEFIRFNNKGDIERRLIRYDPDAKLGTFSNPILMAGDVINVRKSPIGVFTSTLNEFTSPILITNGIIQIFGGGN